MKRLLYIFILISPLAAPAADLEVAVADIAEAKGNILVALHASADTWGDDSDFRAEDFRAFARREIPAAVSEVRLLFKDLPPGRYALTAIHDRNGNGRLDRFIFPFPGMPSEPYALSNEAWSLLHKGGFSEAAFELPAGGRSVTLTLRTHLERIGGGSGAENGEGGATVESWSDL